MAAHVKFACKLVKLEIVTFRSFLQDSYLYHLDKCVLEMVVLSSSVYNAIIADIREYNGLTRFCKTFLEEKYSQ